MLPMLLLAPLSALSGAPTAGLTGTGGGEPCGAAAWCQEDAECTFEQLPMAERGGVTYTVPYYSNAGDIVAAGSDEWELALVVSHGAVPDPGGYWCAGMDAAARQGGADPSRILVVAPWYLGTGAGVEPTATQLQWTAAGNWRDGADSDPAGGRPGDVSSYSVIDVIVERLLLSGDFPRLRGAVLWGDSAGGQVLSRYALTTQLPPAAIERLRILPSNPSSFPYVNDRRWNYTLIDGQCVLGELAVPDAGVVAACPEYDAWRYGIADSLPPYVQQGLDLQRFPSMPVVWVQGELDVCNEDGTCGTEECPSGGLDRGCAAMLQGPMRLWRGRQYMAALGATLPSLQHRLLELPGVGHDAYEVARSPPFLDAAFSGWPEIEGASEDRPPPAVVGWDGKWLAALRNHQIESGAIRPSLRPALEALQDSAAELLTLPPPSVVTEGSAPPVGTGISPHALWYLATYAWPCGTECNRTRFPGDSSHRR